ncbi:MAG: serine/threonine protein kinase [Archangiaceae bacterium]|nr:serine/threonine protein kinase [Archangiaceae bacterium]
MSLAFGRYELLKKLASGGMGQVFLARRRGVGFEKLVVLKRILPHLVEDEDFLTMFLDEARLTARLNHPNIAQIFDVDVEAGQHLVVMEYVQGDDVRRLWKKAAAEKRPLPLGAVLRIVADAAAGLDHAHQARDDQGQPLGLVHRDVSPQNLLVGFDGGVKLIDFGVAKAAGRAQHTDTGVLKGKFPYMSPEQANGEPLDARSDVFALGIVLWELLCGERLFKGESDVMSQRLVRACQVPAPSQLRPELTPALDAIVLKALSKDREQRYPSALAFREALEGFCHEAHVPASTAHLAAFMRSLYADRLDELTDPSKLDQLSPDASLEGITSTSRGTGPSAVVVSGRATRGAPDAEVDISTRHSATEHVPRQRRSRAGVFIGFALFAALGAAASVSALMFRAPPVPAPQPAPVVVPSASAAPQALELKVESDPASANVEIAGVPRGTTPLDVKLDPTALPVLLKLTLDGYEPQQTTLTSSSGPTVTLLLKKKRSAAAAHPLEIKTGR